MVGAGVITHLTSIFQVNFFLRFEISYAEQCMEIRSHIALKIVPVVGLPSQGNSTKNKALLCSVVRRDAKGSTVLTPASVLLWSRDLSACHQGDTCTQLQKAACHLC